MFDPVLVMRAILEKAHRIVSNLLPSVWMRTKLVGSVARCLNATTMERPVDFQKPGSGKIYMSDTAGSPLLVRGIDTDFEREARAGDYLILPKHGGVSAMATVQEIRSSNEIVLKRPFRP
jgi:glycerol-3-phosphate O-acyltransferase/dihydroxyacetone phosphate acyltransferase